MTIWLVWLGWFSARPNLMTDLATLAGDGSALDYCALPALGDSGLRAAEIPKGNTPACGYDHFPLPILAACTEPLPPEADDIRGLWRGVSGGHVGHVERVEQCGNRVVVTAAGLIHDYGPNSTGGLNTNDTEGSVLHFARQGVLYAHLGEHDLGRQDPQLLRFWLGTESSSPLPGWRRGDLGIR